jgi:hypothetical protein
MDKNNAFYLINQMEKMLVEENAEYPDVMAASLFIAVVSANNMGMDKEMFMNSCESLFDSDKKEQFKELQ